ncbi:AcrR family transcriptional regulator [Cellulosimicrobium cellulans]|uniref:TetR/AcrR family transcriptional regulator n=1 Tax=Cellulosimicrobium cellulans TaxID=1710 RepID=UPI001959EC2F|nr:TetR/AcrR family transcriptional regulator [Cellulosimicrobium cellulans]MBM7819109.1 AcrR family transcriptional regulator [Cellulosimicrobium cellulans]
MTGASEGRARGTAGPPVAARTRMPRDERRTQLLTIAEELFASHGYHHISMDDIADRAGVGKPVLYRHFPSKLDLYLALIDDQGDRLVRAVHVTLDPFREPAPGISASDLDALAVDGLAVIEGIVRAYVAYARTAGRSAALLFESDVMRDPVVRARVLAPDARIAGAFADVLVRITDLDADEALVVSRTCTAVGRAAATEAVRPDGTASADDVTRLVPRLVWRGVHGMLRRPRAGAPDAAGTSMSGVAPEPDADAALDGSTAGI